MDLQDPMIVEVLLDLPLPRGFDYHASLVTEEDVGRRVKVPWGTGQKVGVIRALKHTSTYPPDKIREVLEIWRDIPPLNARDWQLLEFCSAYYHYPLGQTVLAMLPPALRRVGGWLPPRRVRQSRKDPAQSSTLPLNEAQRTVVQTILRQPHFAVHLIHGVTGSGKTEVYFSLIEEVLRRGRQVLLLVPEINLTPQLEQRLARRWPALDWVSLHSGVSEKERARRWLAAQAGTARLVLGTRLAVFTPLPELGLIVVDEEHEASFKQQDGLRYSARDMAIVRARQGEFPIVLGSATPTLESWHNARSGRYQLHHLRERAVPGACLPQLTLVPTAQEGISPHWVTALHETLDRGEQVLVFINRRGYAPVLYCPNCGWQAACPRCSVRLVVHRRARQLRCHHCGLEQVLNEACPSCGNVHMETRGEGTQQVEERLRTYCPSARLLRLDSDSLALKGSWEKAREQILDHRVDILVGTQLLVKGHDFPDLSLVVVLNADQSLFSSDFRASERLYAQLLQVAGRAGRADKTGQVWIETDYPGHPVLLALLQHETENFLDQELALRRQMGWPPFSYLAILRVEARDVAKVAAFLDEARQKALAREGEGISIFDPVPSSLARKAGFHRWQLLVQGAQRTHLQAFLTGWVDELRALRSGQSIHWVLEVDPWDC